MLAKESAVYVRPLYIPHNLYIDKENKTIVDIMVTFLSFYIIIYPALWLNQDCTGPWMTISCVSAMIISCTYVYMIVYTGYRELELDIFFRLESSGQC